MRHWLSNHEAEIGTPAFGGSIPGFVGAEARRRTKEPKNTIGNVFYGSKGYMALDGYDRFKTWLGEDHEPGPSAVRGGNNWANFIDCVRSRRKENLNAPIEEGHISCTLLHLANASYRLGRTLRFDPATEQVMGDAEANRILRGTYRAPYVVPEKV